MANKNVIYGINGPVVTVKDTRDFSMMEMVYVSDERLVGEVIGITDKLTTIQVYEETTGLKLGDPIYGTGEPMNILLGPGIIDNIFDGIERPLKAIEESTGSSFISRGAAVSSLDDKKQWDVTITAKVGDYLKAGQIYATCPETPIIEHRCILSPKIKGGKVIKVEPNGKYKINDTVVTIEDDEGIKHELTLCQAWPIRTPRPSAERLSADVPLITGQRVIDTLFPISKGGTAAIPGGFGTGKTMTQHQLAKWCDADIIVYVGCGERGNEMSQVLTEFSELVDPKSGRPMTDRTVLIANTSNMPVAAREAQKNMAPAGLTVVIIREDLIGHARDITPTMLDYKTHADNGSMFNTPPCYTIYIAKLVLEWIKNEIGGLENMQKLNEKKAALLYNFLDNSKMFRGTVVPEDRSLMNVPFVTGSDELDAKFVKEATEQGLVNIKGHRTVGGMRASIYNAMPYEGVEALVKFMAEFEAKNS